jgi:hypothetical protein
VIRSALASTSGHGDDGGPRHRGNVATHCRIGAAIALVAILLGCADGPAIEGPPLRPGDSWFDRAADVEILRISPTNLPEGLPAHPARLLRSRREVIRPEDWVRAGRSMWSYTPNLSFGLRLGARRLTYDGSEIQPQRPAPSPDGQEREYSVWIDEKSGLHLEWDSPRGRFQAHSGRPSQRVEFGYEDDSYLS